jgi:hypothetical protein
MAVENAFPTPPNPATFGDSILRLKGRVSPAPKRFSEMNRAQSTPPEITHAHHFGLLGRKTDGQLSDVASLENSWRKLHVSKKRSQYYDGAFAYREPNNIARERVAKDSVILADFKLNCCVRYLTDIACTLADCPLSSLSLRRSS